MNKINHFINMVKDIIKELGIIFLYIFISLSLNFIINKRNKLTFTLSSLLVDLITLIVFLFIFRKEIFPQIKDFKKNGFKYIKKYFIFYLISIIVMIISSKIINKYYILPNNELINQEIILKYPFYAIISLLFISPVIEELIFRVTLKDTFKHQSMYILITSLLFGSLHVLNSLINNNVYELLYLIPYATVGVSLSYMYIKSDNIWTSITFHSIHNLICLLIFLGGIYA